MKTPTNSASRLTAALLGLLGLLGLLPLPAVAADDLEIGRRIYLEGRLPSGRPLSGVRFDGTAVSGAEAACVSCHRRSGLGSVEGNIVVPPITGKFLFASDEAPLATMDQRRRKSFNQAHEPYDEASFARAVRQGIAIDGRTMQVVMPHYALGNPELRALTTYLRQLSAAWSPGVTEESIRLATVITPGVSAARRQALLDTLRSAVAQKNGSTAPGRRHMVSPAEMMSRSERNWQLDVWELQGEPSTWAAQLAENYRRQPVFALLSGVTDSTWQPVHEFCRQEGVPCWFPSVDLPAAQEDFYNLYFSRGVVLEADVLARHLLDSPGPRPKRLIQIHRDNAVGQAAAQALAANLAGSGITLDNRPLGMADPLPPQLNNIDETDAVMFWLAPADLQSLAELSPGPARRVFFSGELGNIQESSFPPAWKSVARLVYPYELPAQRAANLAYFHTWLKLRRLPLVDETLQSEAYFAISFLSDTLAEMLHNVHRDYLLERAEEMLSKREGGKAEEEARMRLYLGRPGDLTRKYGTGNRQAATRDLPLSDSPAQAGPASDAPRRAGTTIYPRLSLAQHQRFASKGAYIVRFDPQGKLVVDTEWTIP
ncbi:MAG: ABC transporter substrate-binding protein [Azonexus sp.]